MKHTIEAKPFGVLNITVEGVGDSTGRMLSALQECAEGRCNCPTPQYGKLSNIEIRTDSDAVTIRLDPRPNETLDVADIEKCLAYTEDKATKG